MTSKRSSTNQQRVTADNDGDVTAADDDVEFFDDDDDIDYKELNANKSSMIYHFIFWFRWLNSNRSELDENVGWWCDESFAVMNCVVHLFFIDVVSH